MWFMTDLLGKKKKKKTMGGKLNRFGRFEQFEDRGHVLGEE